jgi:hypothetical protein
MNLITFSYKIALAGCHWICKRPYNNSKLHPTCIISKLANHCDLALKVQGADDKLGQTLRAHLKQ